MTKSGWICVHRKLTDHWIWENAEYYKAWSAILFEVNHASRKVVIGTRVFIVERGESLNSQSTWAKRFGDSWNRMKVQRFFTMLSDDGMIITKNERKTSRLTVVNYSTYQNQLGESEPIMSTSRAGYEPIVSTNNHENNSNHEEQCLFSEGKSAPIHQQTDTKINILKSEDNFFDWKYTAEFAALRKAGARPTEKTWMEWMGLIEQYDINTILNALKTTSPASRFDPAHCAQHITDSKDQITREGARRGITF